MSKAHLLKNNFRVSVEDITLNKANNKAKFKVLKSKFPRKYEESEVDFKTDYPYAAIPYREGNKLQYIAFFDADTKQQLSWPEVAKGYTEDFRADLSKQIADEVEAELSAKDKFLKNDQLSSALKLSFGIVFVLALFLMIAIYFLSTHGVPVSVTVQLAGQTAQTLQNSTATQAILNTSK